MQYDHVNYARRMREKYEIIQPASDYGPYAVLFPYILKRSGTLTLNGYIYENPDKWMYHYFPFEGPLDMRLCARGNLHMSHYYTHTGNTVTITFFPIEANFRTILRLRNFQRRWRTWKCNQRPVGVLVHRFRTWLSKKLCAPVLALAMAFHPRLGPQNKWSLKSLDDGILRFIVSLL